VVYVLGWTHFLEQGGVIEHVSEDSVAGRLGRNRAFTSSTMVLLSKVFGRDDVRV